MVEQVAELDKLLEAEEMRLNFEAKLQHKPVWTPVMEESHGSED